jgi:hypothetical protein
MWRAMTGQFGVLARRDTALDIIDRQALWYILALSCACLVLPTTQGYLARYRPALGATRVSLEARRRTLVVWRPTPLHAVFTLALLLTSLALLERPSEFLYFRF